MYQKNKIIGSLVFLIFIFSLGNICNAAISNARPIQLNTPVTGSLPERSTKNYYAIELPADGYIRIDFEHENLTESSIGWAIILYNDESKQIESFFSRWNAPDSSSANIGLPAGTYYILVEYGDRHNNADYTLTVNYNSSDYWEKELNNTVLRATEMQLNQPYMGSINDRRDKDYYRISLNADGYIRIDFEHENLTESSIGWGIILYNDESKQIESFFSRWNAPDSSSANIGLPAGTYYILVEYGDRHNNTDYILTANYNQTENQAIGGETDNDIEVEGVSMEDESISEDEAELGTSDEETSETIDQNVLVEKNELYIPIGILLVIIIILSIFLFLVKARRKA